MVKCAKKRVFTGLLSICGILLLLSGCNTCEKTTYSGLKGEATKAVKIIPSQKKYSYEVNFEENIAKKDFLPKLPNSKKWELVFNDEFNSETIDANKWKIMGDGKRKAGYWLKECSELDGKGNLVISTKKVGEKYATGGIRTREKHQNKFGFYQMRFKLTKCKGHGPAFWLMCEGVRGSGNEGEDGTEIDIFEKFYNNNRIQHALHWDYANLHSIDCQIDVPGINQGYHTISCWWTPEEYIFYVDGNETWRTNHGGVSKVPVDMIISDEIRGWNGDISKQDLPHYYYVDYVRVYQQTAK